MAAWPASPTISTPRIRSTSRLTLSRRCWGSTAARTPASPPPISTRCARRSRSRCRRLKSTSTPTPNTASTLTIARATTKMQPKTAGSGCWSGSRRILRRRTTRWRGLQPTRLSLILTSQEVTPFRARAEAHTTRRAANREIPFMSKRIARREFLGRSALAGAAVGLGVWSSRSLAESKSPNEKLNIAMIGTANQARFSIENVKQENIVALCDIDDNYLAKAKSDFPRAKAYNDFRKLLEQNDIEAVVVAVPDHIHAFATAGALHLGKHVYCEKPLTHTVSEARAIAE